MFSHYIMPSADRGSGALGGCCTAIVSNQIKECIAVPCIVKLYDTSHQQKVKRHITT